MTQTREIEVKYRVFDLAAATRNWLPDHLIPRTSPRGPLARVRPLVRLQAQHVRCAAEAADGYQPLGDGQRGRPHVASCRRQSGDPLRSTRCSEPSQLLTTSDRRRPRRSIEPPWQVPRSCAGDRVSPGVRNSTTYVTTAHRERRSGRRPRARPDVRGVAANRPGPPGTQIADHHHVVLADGCHRPGDAHRRHHAAGPAAADAVDEGRRQRIPQHDVTVAGQADQALAAGGPQHRVHIVALMVEQSQQLRWPIADNAPDRGRAIRGRGGEEVCRGRIPGRRVHAMAVR